MIPESNVLHIGMRTEAEWVRRNWLSLGELQEQTSESLARLPTSGSAVGEGQTSALADYFGFSSRLTYLRFADSPAYVITLEIEARTLRSPGARKHLERKL